MTGPNTSSGVSSLLSDPPIPLSPLLMRGLLVLVGVSNSFVLEPSSCHTQLKLCSGSLPVFLGSQDKLTFLKSPSSFIPGVELRGFSPGRVTKSLLREFLLGWLVSFRSCL